MIPVALGIGFFVGRQIEKTPGGEPQAEQGNTRDSRPSRRQPRTDPLGGLGFRLSSMDDLREIFRRQGNSVASARITLAVSVLSPEEIPALVEMVQKEFLKNPDRNVFGNRDGSASQTLMNALFERWAVVDPAASIAFVNSCSSRSFRKRAAGACFGALGKVDPARAVREFEMLPKGETRKSAGRQLLSALADSDPSTACDLLMKESSSGPYGDYYSSVIFEKWAETDPVAAAARLSAMPPDRVSYYSAKQLAAKWAQKDPAAALDWAKTLKGNSKSYSVSEVYKVIARENPEDAWDRLKSEPGHMRGAIAGGILGVVADEDPQHAMLMLLGMQSKSEQRIATSQFLSHLNWLDPRLGFEIIDQVKDPVTRRENLNRLIYSAAYLAPDLMKEQLGKMTDREKVDTSESVMRGLISSDPAAAERYFLSLPETQRDTDSLSRMMWSYANTNPDKAFDFAISLQNPQEQTAAVKGLFENWSREDPEAAAAGWKKLPDGQSRLEALDNVASSWGRSDPETAKAWADSLSGIESTRALAAVLPSMARDNPGVASSQLSSLIATPPDGMEKNLANSAGKLAGQWASDDPEAAAGWAAALPDGQSRDEGLKAVSKSWSDYDAIATAQWLGTLESGSSRDAAIQPLVKQIRETDPTTAFSWAASISDESQRLNQLRQTLSSWRESDLAAARAAFDSADLTDKERQSLAKELE